MPTNGFTADWYPQLAQEVWSRFREPPPPPTWPELIEEWRQELQPTFIEVEDRLLSTAIAIAAEAFRLRNSSGYAYEEFPGRLAEKLAGAMRSAFKRNELERYLYYDVKGFPRDELGTGSAMSAYLQDVIDWFGHRGRLDDLLDSLLKRRSENPRVVQVVNEVKKWLSARAD
jgi:hypothetical protein